MLQILNRFAWPNLISVATVQAKLGAADATPVADLKQLISEATSAIEKYLGRTISRHRCAETVRGHDGEDLYLEHHPIDPDSVTVSIDGEELTDWAVTEPQTGKLFRNAGWPDALTEDGKSPLTIAVTYHAGYITPDAITDWVASMSPAIGSWVRPSSPALTPLLFEVTAKTAPAGATEPEWPTTAGVTVTSAGVTFTGRRVEELPQHIVDLAWLAIYAKHGAQRPGVASISADGMSEQYFATHTDRNLPPNVERGLDLYRY